MPATSEEILLATRGLEEVDFGGRLSRRDAAVFGLGEEETAFIGKFLGWVGSPGETEGVLPEVLAFSAEVLVSGFTDAVVCGMGGSSLSALLFAGLCGEEGFGTGEGLRLHVLDSTNPADVLRVRRGVDLGRTLVVVASKSGTTVEPLAMEEFFWSELVSEFGERGAAERMVAITDPGSEMHTRAEGRGYRRVFVGTPEIGGRFSAFSVFGVVPAALGGFAVWDLLSGGQAEHLALSEGRSGWVDFGAALAAHSRWGADKLTLWTEGRFDALGLWAEQLIAESTGKHGVGVLPLATEPRPDPAGALGDVYGDDRVVLDLTGAWGRVRGLEGMGLPWYRAGAPVNAVELGRTLYGLMLATAAAGRVLGVNPFDQPNVQEAKDIARAELAKIQASGSPSFGVADAASGGVEVFGSAGETAGKALADFLNLAEPGDHVGFLVFLPESAGVSALVQRLRRSVRDRLHVATSFGYGPRYLHSTGQYHKGGPKNGLFVVVTSGDLEDVGIPGMGATFGQLKDAQALGDIGALRANGQRVVHVRLPSQGEGALDELVRAMGVAG